MNYPIECIYSARVLWVIRSSKNIFNISFKWRLIHYTNFDFFSIFNHQGFRNIMDCNTFLLNEPSIFLSFYPSIGLSKFVKWSTFVKRYLNPSDIICLNNVKHISQSCNYRCLSIFLPLNIQYQYAFHVLLLNLIAHRMTWIDFYFGILVSVLYLLFVLKSHHTGNSQTGICHFLVLNLVNEIFYFRFNSYTTLWSTPYLSFSFSYFWVISFSFELVKNQSI